MQAAVSGQRPSCLGQSFSRRGQLSFEGGLQRGSFESVPCNLIRQIFLLPAPEPCRLNPSPAFTFLMRSPLLSVLERFVLCGLDSCVCVFYRSRGPFDSFLVLALPFLSPLCSPLLSALEGLCFVDSIAPCGPATRPMWGTASTRSHMSWRCHRTMADTARPPLCNRKRRQTLG